MSTQVGLHGEAEERKAELEAVSSRAGAVGDDGDSRQQRQPASGTATAFSLLGPSQHVLDAPGRRGQQGGPHRLADGARRCLKRRRREGDCGGSTGRIHRRAWRRNLRDGSTQGEDEKNKKNEKNYYSYFMSHVDLTVGPISKKTV